MASRRGSIAMFLVKWLVIPVGLAAIGFFVVGPMITKYTAAKAPPARAESAPTITEPSEPKRTGDPQVEVSARPASRPRTNRRPSRPRTQRQQPPPEAPSPDEEPPRSGPDGA